jgi:N-acetylmuramoyl-L-alanine amidase
MDMDEEALFLAHQENKVRDALEDSVTPEALPSDLAAILKDLEKMNETERSYQWARAMRTHCRAEFPGRSCKMRQAPFHVLSMTQMPAVLVEMGFITNAQDRTLLEEAAGQEKMVRSLGRATMEFIEKLDKTVPYVHSLPHENRRPPSQFNAQNSTDSELHQVR